MIDMPSMVLLVIGALFLILAFAKVFGNKSTLFGVVSLFVLIFGFLGAVGTIDYSKFGGSNTQNQPIVFVPSNPSPPPSPSCSPNAITSNHLSQANVQYYNNENATGAGYIAATARITSSDSSSLLGTTTTNAGGASTGYVTISSIPNCVTGNLYAVVTTGTGVASSNVFKDATTGQITTQVDFMQTAARNYVILGASGDVLSLDASDFTGAVSSSWQINGSAGSEISKDGNGHLFASGTGTADGNAYFKNTTIGAKGNINFIINAQVNGSASVFGAYNAPDGVIISYTLPTSGKTKFSSNSLTLQSNTAGWSLTKLGSCPADIASNRNAIACWSAPTMKAGVLYGIKGTLTADTGDPVIGDNPTLNFDDRQFFVDTTGITVYQAFSSSGGTNQGVGGTIFNFVVN